MPYIAQPLRKELQRAGPPVAETPGELNYLFTVAAVEFIKAKGLSY